ncbi:MAG: hypothetical protein RL020_1942 [Pseudomonadota bacterium]|jgi:hypothetical protein
MNKSLIGFLLFLLVSSCVATPPLSLSPDSKALIGKWKVDLRPKPQSEAYFQTFEVTEINGKKFQGSFYGTPISEGRINTDWNGLYFAFVTQDQSGPYNHSGVLRGNKIEGLSNSTGRDFLSYWSAEKEK